MTEDKKEKSIISIRLKGLRDKEGYKQAYVCEEVLKKHFLNENLTKVLSNYETGKRTPNYEIIVDFAEFYGVTTDYILGASDYENEGYMPIQEITGLSSKSIDAITFIKENFPKNMPIVNAMLTDANFINLIVSIEGFAIKDNTKLWFVETRGGSQYSEAIDDKEAEAFKLFRLNDTFKSYMDDVIKKVKGGTE